MISKHEIIRRIDRIAALSPVMTRILEKLNQPGLKIADLEVLIRMEPALILNILKECNSPIWGRSRKLTNLKEAIVYLGLNKIKTVIMYSCFLPYINMPYPGYEDRNGELWRHSMGVSILAEEIAGCSSGLDPHSLFLSSVFHDIGKMV
ncbi:MAG: HDOD domain-containing protein [Candidatus Delongbacteria bacterium]|nr:HDOD domain-containing protein [Candidatus Delongbacteria bacterium]